MITLSIILTVVVITSFFIIRNLVLKNEKLEDIQTEYENFIIKQNEAIQACEERLNQIDDKLPILTRPIRLAHGATKAVLATKGFNSSKEYFFIFSILNKSRFKNIKI